MAKQQKGAHLAARLRAWSSRSAANNGEAMASWIGKIIGGVLGAAMAGPVGAALGVLAGHQYDVHVETGGRGVASAGGVARVQLLFFPATFRLMGHIAKADGRVSEQEIAAARSLMQALRLSSVQTAQAIEHYTQGKQPDFVLGSALHELRVALAPYPQLAQFFIELQLQVALAGNGLAARPRERLRAAAGLLGINDASFARLEAMMRWRAGATRGAAASSADSGRLEQAYALLEIERSASDEQVVKAYRRQMSRHHPDKLQANGLPESMLERAKERTQQIQAGYELIRAVRGMR
jgi:DnaJ like chaperone protein